MEYIGNFKKIQLYINANKKPIEEIMTEVGCDFVMNGGLYNVASFTPVCCLKYQGNVIVDDGYKYWGYAWNDGSKIEISNDISKYKNYICCVCMIKDGKKEKMYLASALQGRRERTAIGRFKDGRIWLHVQQYPLMTPIELQDYAESIGVQDAIMLDGGGSTQCLSTCEAVPSTRVVHNYICVWFDDEDKKFNYIYKPTTKADGWKNNALPNPKGIVLHSTATPSANATTMQIAYNKPKVGASVHAFVDDNIVVQCLPWCKQAGHVGRGSNGTFNSSHIGVEMCEPSGVVYNKNYSEIISYNPPSGYFQKTWNNAVELFAYLCKKFELNPLVPNVIVSHSEAHALGYGSNHADVGHWFKWEHKTMDDFRSAVDIALKRLNKVVEENPIEFKEFSYEQWKAYMERYLNEERK